MFDFEETLKLVAQQTVLCVGDIMLDDFVYGDVTRISPEAPTPVLAVRHTSTEIGGAGNVARNIAALGARCIFVALIGNDDAGLALTNALGQARWQCRARSRGRPAAADDAESALCLGAPLVASDAGRLGNDRADHARRAKPR